MSRRIDFIETAAFGGACLFIVCLYTSPSTLYPALEPWRPAMLGALAMIGGVLARRLFRGTPVRLTGGVGVAMGGLFMLAGASALWSRAPGDAMGFFLESIKLFAAFVGIVGALSSPDRIRLAMRLGALVSVVPAIGTIRRHADGIGLVEGYRGTWIGLLANPNQLAMVMAVTVPWCLSEALRAKGIVRAVLFGVLCAQCWCVVVTYSRGGSLGLAMALLAFAFFSRERLKSLAIVAVAATLVVAFAPKSFWERTQTIGAYHLDASAQGRLRAWETGFKALEEHPLIGVGAGSYVHAWDRYQPRNIRERAYAAHNMWMQVAVELGGIGLVLFATMFLLMLRGLWRARANPSLEIEARALLSSFTALVVCGTTGGYAFNWFFYMALGMAGAVVTLSRIPNTEPDHDVAMA